MPTSQLDDAFWLKAWFVLTVATLVWDILGQDRWVASHFVNAQGFIYRNHPLWAKAAYSLQVGLSWLGFIALIILAIKPWGGWQALSRQERWWLIVIVALNFVMVSVIKRLSDTSCPWFLAEFGGIPGVTWVSHWNLWLRDAGPGRCFPSGHASAAFGFFAVAVFLSAFHRVKARAVFLFIIVLGIWTSMTQIMRGAHFVSHCLWTAWLCLSLSLIGHKLAIKAAHYSSPQK
jgi:membrane-associated PAP2 superfamily phosphatase